VPYIPEGFKTSRPRKKGGGRPEVRKSPQKSGSPTVERFCKGVSVEQEPILMKENQSQREKVQQTEYPHFQKEKVNQLEKMFPNLWG